jgi:hypothetical protein
MKKLMLVVIIVLLSLLGYLFFGYTNNQEVVTVEMLNGEKVAESEKMDIAKTKIVLTSTDGKKIAKLERDLINILSDTWTVDIYQREKIDVRILPIIVAYKTYSDDQ